jgi:uncharacterized protein YbaR (Trm112 family)
MKNDLRPSTADLQDLLDLLACPVTGSRLRRDGDYLVSEEGGLRYPIEGGIPVLLRERAVLPEGVATLDGFTRKVRS